MKKIWSLLAALLLSFTFVGGSPAHAAGGGLFNCNYGVAPFQYYGQWATGRAWCNSAYAYQSTPTHIRVMIQCASESGQTGWLYGPWQYAPGYVSNRTCNTAAQYITYVTYQLY